MPNVTFIEWGGNETPVDVENGKNLMQAGTAAGISGIIGDCGGNLSCATCHVFVDPDYIPRIPAPNDYEKDMLEFTATAAEDNSRLCCQIVMSDALDGLIVWLPQTQE